MLELAMHSDGQGIYQKEISKRQEISFKYLDQLISSLKAAGLITNAGGRMSGYVLAKDASRISMYDIYKAFEPELVVADCVAGDNDCTRSNSCAVKEFWNGLNELVIEYMEGSTLEQLAAKQGKMNGEKAVGMYYI
jgi:Rrf2 family protein